MSSAASVKHSAICPQRSLASPLCKGLLPLNMAVSPQNRLDPDGCASVRTLLLDACKRVVES